MIRPANYPPRNPGRGYMIFEKNGRKIAVMCLLGVAAFKRVHLKNPFSLLPQPPGIHRPRDHHDPPGLPRGDHGGEGHDVRHGGRKALRGDRHAYKGNHGR